MCALPGCPNIARHGAPHCMEHGEMLSVPMRMSLKRTWRAYSADPMSKTALRDYERALDAANRELTATAAR